MYCSCLRPFPVKNSASGEEFIVCVSGKGGCGLEIKVDKSEEKVKENVSVLLDGYSGKVRYICYRCKGSGRDKDKSIHNICAICDGAGILIFFR